MLKLLPMIISSLCVFCSSPDRPHSDPSLPEFPRAALEAEVERIKPQLLYCDNFPGTATYTPEGSPQCHQGDGFIAAGVFSSAGHWEPNFIQGAQDAIADSGQPFRSLSHRLDSSLDPGSSSFSRDQLLGLLHLTLTFPELQPLAARVRTYAETHGWMLCGSVTACRVTLSMRILWKLAMGESVSEGEIAHHETTLLAEAVTVPAGYQQFLVSQDVWFMIRLNKNSEAYREVARKLRARTPNNLWFSTLAKMANAENNFVDEANGLLECMKKWTRPGLHHTFSASRADTVCEERPEGAMGHELVWLANLLINEQKRLQGWNAP